MSNPIYLALDVPQLDQGKALINKVKLHIGGVKLGLEFFCAHGPHGVHDIAHCGLPIFLDLKFHDIPNTVAGAMQSIHVLEPAIVTVHASGGRAPLADAKAAAAENPKDAGVTNVTPPDERGH
ncbi:MAG TPA: orotidine-5'-phosphate decarboxylase, partial [Erythrobacter sp.]|nr:orotidine-5'-phosphate decarboxylase [Erythrobacter sp.]